MQAPRTLDLRVPVPRPVQSYMPLLSVVLTLFVAIFRLVTPVVDNATAAFRELEKFDPQVIQEQQAARAPGPPEP